MPFLREGDQLTGGLNVKSGLMWVILGERQVRRVAAGPPRGILCHG